MQTHFGLSRLNAQDDLGPKSSQKIDCLLKVIYFSIMHYFVWRESMGARLYHIQWIFFS